MEHLQIHTSQNVAINQQLAGVGNRIAATVLDIIIIAVYLYAMFSFFNLVDMDKAISYVFLLPVFFYSLLFEVFMEGQTPGKMILRIKVVRLDGSSPAFGDLLLRWIFRIVDIWFFSGMVAVLAILFTEKGQRIGDLLAGTTVISLKKRPRQTVNIYRNLRDDYQPSYHSAFYLQEKDIYTLAMVLEKTTATGKRHANPLVQEAAGAMRKRLNINDDIDDRTFLEILIKDYNYFVQSKSSNI